MFFLFCHAVGDKPVFQCELCPTTCGRKTDLRIHVQKLHTSDKPLKCKRCGKTFPDRWVLCPPCRPSILPTIRSFVYSTFIRPSQYRARIYNFFFESPGIVTSFTARHTRAKNATSAISVHTRQYPPVTLRVICSFTRTKNHTSATTVISLSDRSSCWNATAISTTIRLTFRHPHKRRLTSVPSARGLSGTKAISFGTWPSTIRNRRCRRSSKHSRSVDRKRFRLSMVRESRSWRVSRTFPTRLSILPRNILLNKHRSSLTFSVHKHFEPNIFCLNLTSNTFF